MKNNTKPSSVSLLIIDESGSMSGMNSYVLETYSGIRTEIENEKNEFPELTQYLSVWTFESNNIIERLPFTEVNAETMRSIAYKPAGGTPLFDAMGKSLTRLKDKLDSMGLNEENCRVGVAIITDGEENASRNYSAAEIRLLVEQLQRQGWEFTYYGTDHDVKQMAERMAIYKHTAYEKNAAGYNVLRQRQIAEEKSAKLNFLKKFK
jgi:uncharacterized protein YegL